MSIERIQENIQGKLIEFRNVINYREDLTLSDPFELRRELEKVEGNPRKLPEINGSNESGVYIFCSLEEGKIIYIGKSSQAGAIGFRIWWHLGKHGSPEVLFKGAKEWVAKNPYDLVIFTITLIKKHWFMAAALEEFLIYEFRPKDNKIGKRS